MSKSSELIGDVETALKDKPIYRFLNDEKYADDFTESGIIKLSTLDYCRKIEDHRGDEGEGESICQLPHCYDKNGLYFENNKSVHKISDAIIFCMSLDRNLKKFGRFCIEITDPRQFMDCATNQLNNTYPEYAANAVVMKTVRYVKKRSHEENPFDVLRSFGTKPGSPAYVVNSTFTYMHPESDFVGLVFTKTKEKYEVEKEVRILWQRQKPADIIKTPIIIRCPEITRFCRRIK